MPDEIRRPSLSGVRNAIRQLAIDVKAYPVSSPTDEQVQKAALELCDGLERVVHGFCLRQIDGSEVLEVGFRKR